ncbi:AI-2E family transporter [Roseomonas gilardii]|uniref:AI-2E family transporter n=1 Tax=Roseomonas gilardii TaxID=257708 RepID=UPI0004B4708F|nr:AI-2E family transporter [Roseomonas gilardii]SUE62840.1 pheromone autoinducer 2 transporter [Roseomonas gilardii subsp. rosea]
MRLPESPGARARIRAAGLPNGGIGTLYAIVAVVGILYVARELLVPLVLATLLAFVLAPVVRGLRRGRVPRIPAVLLTAFLAFGLLTAGGVMMGRQMAELASDLPRYQAAVMEKVGHLSSGGILERVSGLLQRLGENVVPRASAPASPSPAAEAGTPVRPLPVEVHTPEPGALELIQSVIAPLVGPVATTGIVAVFVVFLLLYREDMRDRVIKLVGSGDLQRTTAALDEATTRLSRFFLAQVMLNACFGAVIGLGLWAIGIPNPALWGVVAGLMRFVPFVGVIISVAFPALLALAVDPGWGTLLWTLALFAVAEGLQAQAVEPLVYGHSTGLTPIAVLLATAFWTWLWGPLGLLMAMPLTLCLVVLGRHVKQLEFLDVLLGDREALAPPEAFYQRALAGDADGLIEQAELRLNGTSLHTYYDEVALPGLALAQADAARGALSRRRIEWVRDKVDALLEELADHEDAVEDEAPLMDGPVAPAGKGGDKPLAEPLPSAPASVPPSVPPSVPEGWEAPGSVLCVPGRGRFDGQAACMLVQALRQRGFGAGMVPNAALRKPEPMTTAPGGTVRALCLSVVVGGTSGASLRYAVLRLRRDFPSVPLVIGIWGEGEGEASPEQALRDALPPESLGDGRVHFARRLQEAVDTLMQAGSAVRGPTEAKEVQAAKP